MYFITKNSKHELTRENVIFFKKSKTRYLENDESDIAQKMVLIMVYENRMFSDIG